jgi:1-phosphatidylinositol-4-phosphate 5-kinase
VDYQHVVRHDMNKSRFGTDKNRTFSEPNLLVYEYSPYVFAGIREIIGITRESYMRSMGPESMLGNLLLGYLDSMQQLGSEGKSGSLFYLTHDNKYFVKTVRKREFDLIRNSLKHYHDHLSKNPESLLYRITGLYCILTRNGENMVQNYLIVMMNVFAGLQPIFTYDLKGSTYGRTSFKKDQQISSVMKDLDWRNHGMKLDLAPEHAEAIIDNLEISASFLAKLNLIDYSLIVGVSQIQELKPSKSTHSMDEQDRSDDSKEGKCPWNFVSRCGNYHYTIAIVDVWTRFSLTKRLEYCIKSVTFGNGVSCVPPNLYSKRFVDFLKKQF